MATNGNRPPDTACCVLCGHALSAAEVRRGLMACGDNGACLGRWWRRVSETASERTTGGPERPASTRQAGAPPLEGDG